MVYFDERFNPMEFIEIIRDIIYLDNLYLLEDIVDSIKKSKELNDISIIYMIIIWFRFIYVTKYINKYNKKPIKLNTEKNYYFVEFGKKLKIKINKDDYAEDIVTYLDEIKKDSITIYYFLIKNIDKFVNEFIHKYKEELNKKKECNNCPICFEDINIENKIICTYCKNIFHETCINEAWKQNINDCPMCRKLIVKYFFYYSNMRKELLIDIYNLYKKN